MLNISQLAPRHWAGAAAAGLLAITVVQPALAASKDADSNGRQQKVKVEYDGDVTKYCVTEPPLTGSFLPRKICKTADEWKQDGVQINTK